MSSRRAASSAAARLSSGDSRSRGAAAIDIGVNIWSLTSCRIDSARLRTESSGKRRGQDVANTPEDLTITPRDRRFGRGMKQARWWMGGDPVATAFYNALSATFPKGEAFFVEA